MAAQQLKIYNEEVTNMQLIGNGWDNILNEEYQKDYFKKIVLYINKAYKERPIFPPKNYILRALSLTDYNDVKVVILGQDPYHGVGEANGLAFSVNDGIKLPPSLQNIYKELNSDLNIPISTKGDLTCWAKEGVLLLNTVLTVEKDKPASHKNLGWENFTDAIIKKINDVEYTGENMTAAANNIKGAEGTKVKLEIQRGQEIKTFEITRKKITTNPVIAEKLDNNIGYLEVTSFDENTAENFKSKYEELKAQGIDSLIIDLRNNGGGLVEEALKIADYIVPKGKELLVTVDKDGKEKVEKSKEDVLIDMPIVVLVNKNSASSSEILAGALKDLNEATIVGTTTYGKGVIQQFLTLRDGSGLKVTVEEYYTPNRTKINGVGIEPNEKIELPETITNPLTVERKDDTQLQKAIELLKK